MTELVRGQDALSNVAYGEGVEAAMAALESMESRLVDAGILKVRPGGRGWEDVAQAKAAKVRAAKQAERMMGPRIKVRGRSQQKAPDFLRFKSPSGLDIVAGRSSRENDRVTFSDSARGYNICIYIYIYIYIYL